MKHKMNFSSAKTWISFFAVTFLLMANSSCIGPKGEDGFDGRDGRDGRDGNANVGAAIYDVPPSNWEGNIDGFSTTLNVPEINSDIYYNGAILVYMMKNEKSDDKSFNMLPYSWLYNSYTEYMDFDAYLGKIVITLRWVDKGVNHTDAPEGTYTFKVVVIAGTALSVVEKSTDITNPDAVIDYFSGTHNF